MKYAVSLLLVPLAMSAQAEIIYPKGAKATVTVEYSYQSAGERPERPSELIATTWRAKRSVTVTATLAAQPPIGVPTLHKQDMQQKAEVADLEQRSKKVAVQTAPMMDAAMAAYEKCGDNEACLEREIKAMSGAVEQSDVKGARENVAVMSATAAGMNDTPRYQRWEAVAQAASPYLLDEEKNVRSRDPGCERNVKATCTTKETLKGAGTLPASNQGTAMLEVDSKSGDIALALPIPLGVLPATFTRTTDDPDLQSESKQTQVVFPSLSVERAGSLRTPLMVPIKDLRTAAGTLTFPAKGELDEAGTLTVKWRIVPL